MPMLTWDDEVYASNRNAGRQHPPLGSARVSRAGFGVSPKQSLKVREGDTPSPARQRHALPRVARRYVLGLRGRLGCAAEGEGGALAAPAAGVGAGVGDFFSAIRAERGLSNWSIVAFVTR